MSLARVRRAALVVVLWQLAMPFALPAAAACAPLAHGAACCKLERPGQACPMHAKTTGQADCRIRCSAADSSPLALVLVSGALPTVPELTRVVVVSRAISEVTTAVISVPLAFDPPPPRA